VKNYPLAFGENAVGGNAVRSVAGKRGGMSKHTVGSVAVDSITVAIFATPPRVPRSLDTSFTENYALVPLRPVLLFCVALFLCAGSLLSAQELFDIALHFLPASGGSPEEREFFDRNMPREIRGAHYIVVDHPDRADLLISVRIAQHENAERPSSITLGLITAVNNALMLELFWDYLDREEMYAWDIGGILAPAGRIFLRGPDVSGRFNRLRRLNVDQTSNQPLRIALKRQEDL
jgi:hypothetical protein